MRHEYTCARRHEPGRHVRCTCGAVERSEREALNAARIAREKLAITPHELWCGAVQAVSPFEPARDCDCRGPDKAERALAWQRRQLAERVCNTGPLGPAGARVYLGEGGTTRLRDPFLVRLRRWWRS